MKILITLSCALFFANVLAGAEFPSSDPFTVGSVWKGARNIAKRKEQQNWQFVVDTRDGDKFTATVTMTPKQEARAFTIDVVGTAPASGSGDVRFESIEKGGFDQRFWGRVEAGAMKLEFKGRSRTGEPIEGEAWLTR